MSGICPVEQSVLDSIWCKKMCELLDYMKKIENYMLKLKI